MRKNNYEQRNSNGKVNQGSEKGGKPYSQNANRRNTNNRRKPNQFRKDGKSTEPNSELPTGNDPAFYNKYPAILNQVGKINNYHPVGLMGTDMFGLTPESMKVRPIPGIVSMDVIPAIPVSSSGASTLQQSAYQTWTKVRDAISGSRSYDPVDLQLMSIAVSQAVSCATWIKRFFNFAFTMSPFNRYAPERLFTAMHCDYNDFIENLPQYRARYNRITINLSRIYANTDNNYHQMVRSMFARVYAEPGDNGQLYLYNPGGFYKYKWTDDASGIKVGSLSFIGPQLLDLPVNKDQVLKMENLLSLYEHLVNALITDGDVNTMSGDLLKTYGEKAQVILPLALETDSDIPVYSPVDLAQFQMSYVPLAYGEYANYKTIIQNKASYIQFKPKMSIGGMYNALQRYDNATAAKKEFQLESSALQIYAITQGNRILLNDYIDLNNPANVAEVLRNVPAIADYTIPNLKTAIAAREKNAPLELKLQSTTGILPYAITVWQIDSCASIIDGAIMSTRGIYRNFTFLPMRTFFAVEENEANNEYSITDMHLDANLNDYYSVPREHVAQIQDVMALSMFSDL